MGRAFGSLLGRRRRGGSAVDASSGDPPPTADELRQRARALADAIDQAMASDRWAQAERLARSAPRLVRYSSRLTEQLARLRLAQGEAETALHLVDGAARQPDSMRLLRATCLVQLGRKHEAHADLLCWSRKSTAPLDARLLLAMLEWEAGDEDAAVTALLRNLRQIEDPRTIELLLLVAAARRREDQAHACAERVQQCTSLGPRPPHLDLLVRSLGIRTHDVPHEPTEEQIFTLAMELVSHEHVLPSLVTALEIERHEQHARLLHAALERILDELSDRTRGFECLARTAFVTDDRATAKDWTKRGLEENPLSAALHRLDEQLDPSASGVLAVIGRGPVRKQELAA
jgi:hypothetical protein